MMRPVLYSLTMAFLAGTAYATQIPDYSLSPAETARQPDISHSNTQPYGNQNNQMPGQYPTPLLPNGATATASTNFMDGYCDRNFTPGIASDPRYANLAACVKQQKEQVCLQFQQLPSDVKQVMNEALVCIQSGGDILPPDQEYDQHNPACNNTDATRLQLLKKYWRDPNTAYALVFMPDDVLTGPTKCLRGGQ